MNSVRCEEAKTGRLLPHRPKIWLLSGYQILYGTYAVVSAIKAGVSGDGDCGSGDRCGGPVPIKCYGARLKTLRSGKKEVFLFGDRNDGARYTPGQAETSPKRKESGV